MPEEPILDQQEPTIDTPETDETPLTEPEPEPPNAEEKAEDGKLEPLADLKDLIQTDPDRALERTAQVEAGLIKLQAQKQEAESFVAGIDTVFKGLERGDLDAVSEFERVLYDHTGLTYQGLVDLKKGDRSAVENSKIAILERKLEALENHRAEAAWIAEIGTPVASQVDRETGLEFSPEQLWRARPHLQSGATAEDVRKAVMRVDPDAYDRAVAKRDGSMSPVPRSATMPTGRGGTHKTYDHSPQGFLQAYQAKRARGA